jgi:hypothetical protein
MVLILNFEEQIYLTYFFVAKDNAKIEYAYPSAKQKMPNVVNLGTERRKKCRA